MKSPLVDALRLASGQDKAANSEQAEPESETQQSAAESAPVESGQTLLDGQHDDVPELSLMDATGVLVVQSADDEDDEFATSQIVSEDAVNEADLEAADAAPTHVVEEVVDASAAGVEAVSRDAAPVAVISNNGRMPALARLGLFSPLICLLLASAATGSYFLYQSAGGELQGAGLGMLSPEVGTSGATGVVVEPDTPINRFPLAGAQARTRLSPPATQSPQQVQSPVTTRPDKVPLTSRVNRDLDDRAFAALNQAFAAYEAGNFEASEAAYRRALQIAPRHPNALQGLAAILHRTGRANVDHVPDSRR